jgi:hypothetical protein
MLKRFVFTIIFINSIIFAQEKIYEDNRGFIQEREITFQIKSGGEIRIDTEGGDVFVSTWNKNEVFIKVIKRVDVFSKADAEKAFELREVNMEQRNNTVFIEDKNYSSRGWRSSVNIDYQITTPRKFNFNFITSGGDVKFSDNVEGDIDLRSSGGDLKARDITGKLMFATSGGDIELDRFKGEIDGNTSGGDVEIDEIDAVLFIQTSGGDFDVKRLLKGGKIVSSGGDITLREISGNLDVGTSGGDLSVSDAAGDVEVTTSGGDIDIEKVAGELRLSSSGGEVIIKGAGGSVDISSSGGDISLEILDSRGKSSGSERIRVRAGSGEIQLYLPENINADIDARIRLSSRYDYDSYDIDSDFPIIVSKDSRYKKGSGKINKGGIPIILETSNENIYIYKVK